MLCEGPYRETSKQVSTQEQQMEMLELWVSCLKCYIFIIAKVSGKSDSLEEVMTYH